MKLDRLTSSVPTRWGTSTRSSTGPAISRLHGIAWAWPPDQSSVVPARADSTDSSAVGST